MYPFGLNHDEVKGLIVLGGFLFLVLLIIFGIGTNLWMCVRKPPENKDP